MNEHQIENIPEDFLLDFHWEIRIDQPYTFEIWMYFIDIFVNSKYVKMSIQNFRTSWNDYVIWWFDFRRKNWFSLVNGCCVYRCWSSRSGRSQYIQNPDGTVSWSKCWDVGGGRELLTPFFPVLGRNPVPREGIYGPKRAITILKLLNRSKIRRSSQSLNPSRKRRVMTRKSSRALFISTLIWSPLRRPSSQESSRSSASLL